MNRPKISVAMAVYNGEKYLCEQIDSILLQLGDSDELIISYNESNDSSLEIIESYAKKDSRVHIVQCKESGVIPNFENAINYCNNELIFLADQDDVWNTKKVKVMASYFKDNKIGCVVHRYELVDSDLKIIKTRIPNGETQKLIKPINIILRNEAQGSCMAFRKEYLKSILPFPRNIPMHDSWIALVISKQSKVLLIPDRLILYRQHENNVTARHHQKCKKMIVDRWQLVINIIKRKIK